MNKNCFKSEFGLVLYVKKNYQSTRRVQQIFRRLNTVLSTASILFDIFFDERICNFLQPVSSLWFFCPRVSCTAGRCTSPRKGLLLQVRPEIWSCFNISKSCFLLNFAFQQFLLKQNSEKIKNNFRIMFEFLRRLRQFFAAEPRPRQIILVENLSGTRYMFSLF